MPNFIYKRGTLHARHWAEKVLDHARGDWISAQMIMDDPKALNALGFPNDPRLNDEVSHLLS